MRFLPVYNLVPRLFSFHVLGGRTGGDNGRKRVLRGKARAPNNQDVVNTEPGPATHVNAEGRDIPYCGCVVEVDR